DSNVWMLLRHSHLEGPALPINQRWQMFVERTLDIATRKPLMTVALIAGAAGLLRSPTRLSIAAVSWFLLNAVGVWLQGYFFPHHYTMLFPAIALLGGVALGLVTLPGRNDAFLVGFLRAAMSVAILVWAWSEARQVVDATSGVASAEFTRVLSGPVAWP